MRGKMQAKVIHKIRFAKPAARGQSNLAAASAAAEQGRNPGITTRNWRQGCRHNPHARCVRHIAQPSRLPGFLLGLIWWQICGLCLSWVERAERLWPWFVGFWNKLAPVNRKSGFLFGFVWVVASLWANASVQLDIPPRRQWDNNNGYCGECSIQQCALYYGTYISQYNVREIIDPTQQQDVWAPDNSGPIFDVLRLHYVAWNSDEATPQYQNYLVWTKSHLQQNQPVIIDVYVQGCDDPYYDHIIPATGFTSGDTNTYHGTDTLVFNDNYSTTSFTRLFSTLNDTRAMEGNGAIYEYCIPTDTDFGCAVTGIEDSSGTALPVYLSVNLWNEPNISEGASPVQMNATIQVSALKTGTAYVLLRYNDYHNVPTNNYLSSAYNTATTFVATNSTQTLYDSFMSNGTVIYRCVPAPSAPAINSLQLAGAKVRIGFTTQTNMLYGVDYRNNLATGSWTSLTNNLAGTGGTITITDSGATNQARRFYRIHLAVP
jgi:hypothetical protein